MKSVALGIALSLFCTVSQSQSWQSDCSDIGALAKFVMTFRQSGNAMAQAMKLANGNKLFETVLIEAFETPLYSSDRMIKQSIHDFQVYWYGLCIKARRPR